MQLKDKSIKQALSIATSTLLMTTSAASHGASGTELEMDSSVLFYSEIDRVTAIEPVIRLRKQVSERDALTARLVMDSLTGASASGAIAQTTAQTFTSPSGNSTYNTDANETPLDPSFRDTRTALSVDWERQLKPRLTSTLSAHASGEFDYASLGVAGQLSQDLDRRNTTLNLGLSYNIDLVFPVGDIPVGLSPMPSSAGINKNSVESEDTKHIIELLLGLTQVLNRKTLVQANYTYGYDKGYLTDPYKILSVTDNSGNLRGTDPYLYEQRPETRGRHALYSRMLHQFTRTILDFSYRYFWDDWNISSHTLDIRYRIETGKKSYLQPHVRYYKQHAADFYYYRLIDGAIPSIASADYRLGNLVTSTMGIKYGLSLNEKSELSIRAEYMQQTVDSMEKVPDIDALILQMSFSVFY